MSQTPPPQFGSGQQMPHSRPRPGGPRQAQPAPRYVDYGNPRAYDTSTRPASGLTAARYAPAPIQQPHEAQPGSAWATQTRRVQEVAQEGSRLPLGGIVVWLSVILLSIVLIGVLGYFFLMFISSSSSNPIWWPVTAMVAVVSLIVISGIMVLADRWDPQPVPLLLIAVLWGAALAAGISYVLNTLNQELVFLVTGSESVASFAGAVVSAPLVEETTKGLGLIALMLLARRYFNGPLDGLIYGALIGGGFAFSENILYYTRSVEEAGVLGLVFRSFTRGALGIFGHAIYTSLTGVIMGFVVRKWGTIPAGLVFIVALIPGISLHALWNLGVSVPSGWFTILMFVLQAVLSLLWLIFIVVLIWDESRLTRVRLGDYANLGWLTHEEVDMLATWKGRREGKRWAEQINAKPLMKRFIRESADLASVRQRLLADGAHPKAVQQEAHLLSRLSANRRELLSHAG